MGSYAGSLFSLAKPRLNSKSMSEVKDAQEGATVSSATAERTLAQKALEFEQLAIPLMPQVYAISQLHQRH